MSPSDNFNLLAQYNQWMNQKVYEATARLDPVEQMRDRGAFFGSIFGTLSHLAAADCIWLHRFAAHPGFTDLRAATATLPQPRALADRLFDTFDALRAFRQSLDNLISHWIGGLHDADLDQAIAYANMRGEVARRPLSSLLLHFFNHQTHHRGQVTALLTQAGQDVGVTDLVTLIPSLSA